MLKAYKDAAKQLPLEKNFLILCRLLALIEKELNDNKEAHTNLLDSRRFLQENIEETARKADTIDIARSDLQQEGDNGQVLNIEQHPEDNKDLARILTDKILQSQIKNYYVA